jgi:TM2 domain-containing membrane protein YozV
LPQPRPSRIIDVPTLSARNDVSGQGSAGNVIAALCSFFVPGLGQLLQGRLFLAIIQFCLAAVLWFFLLGWAIHLWSVLDAAVYKPRS